MMHRTSYVERAFQVITFIRAAMLWLFAPTAFAADPPPAYTSLPALTAPEQIQTAVAEKLAKLTTEIGDRQRPLMERMVADIQRTNHLPEDRLNLLRIASQGTLDRSMDGNTESLRREVESRTKNVSPRAVKKVLDGFSGESMYRGEPAVESPFWQAALKGILTEPERKRWEQVKQERQAYRARALAELIAVQALPRAGLSDEQVTKLQPLIEKAVIEYLPDLLRWNGDDDDSSLYAGYVPVFVLGIPEKEARSIVKPEQWEKWQSIAGEYAGNWNWIKEQHDQRVKVKKP